MRDFYLFVVRIVSLAPMGQFARRTLRACSVSAPGPAETPQDLT